jgi:hypothetical protein
VIVEKDHVAFTGRVGGAALMPFAFLVADVMEEMSDRIAFLGAHLGKKRATYHPKGDGTPHCRSSRMERSSERHGGAGFHSIAAPF